MEAEPIKCTHWYSEVEASGVKKQWRVMPVDTAVCLPQVSDGNDSSGDGHCMHCLRPVVAVAGFHQTSSMA